MSGSPRTSESVHEILASFRVPLLDANGKVDCGLPLRPSVCAPAACRSGFRCSSNR